MRISQLPLFCLFALCLGLPVLATDPAIVVSGVRAVPGWPWGNTVDIYYMVFWEDPEAEVTVSFSGWDGDVNWPVDIDESYLSGDGVDTPVKSGTLMHAIWDAGAALPGFQCENFTVKVIADFVKPDKPEEAGGETSGEETTGGETTGGETTGGETTGGKTTGGETTNASTYLVVDLSGGSNATSYPVRYTDEAPDVTSDTCRTTELWLRRIPAGTFIMGSPSTETGRSSGETQHQVTLTQDYYIGVFECTQKQWILVMGSNPSGNTGETRPVENVSYNDVRGSSSTAGGGWPTYGHAVDDDSFMGKLQSKTSLTFDLPTEAQWEYACRLRADGTTWGTALNSGKNLTGTSTCSNLAAVGRYNGNDSDGKGGYSYHTKVGLYLPSELGLYDMHGNVCEWVLDRYDSYSSEAVTDPVGPASGNYQVKRGGSCNLSASNCRAAVRRDDYTASDSNDDIGFRIACVPAP